MQRKEPAVDSGGSQPVLLCTVFRIDAQYYALTLGSVDRVLPMLAVSPFPNSLPIVLGVINLRGAVVPVLDLRQRFGLSARDYGCDGHMLIAHTRLGRVALPVDEVTGVVTLAEQDVVSADSILPPTTRHLKGIVATPDGVLLIQDLDAFLSLDEQRQLSEALNALRA
jgi:purine-binding chemotaxis protein CheW